MKNSKTMTKSTINKVNAEVNEIYEQAVYLSETYGMSPELKELGSLIADLLDVVTIFEKDPTHINFFKCAGALIKCKNNLKINA